jgi:hypothetical protein
MFPDMMCAGRVKDVLAVKQASDTAWSQFRPVGPFSYEFLGKFCEAAKVSVTLSNDWCWKAHILASVRHVAQLSRILGKASYGGRRQHIRRSRELWQMQICLQ